MKRTYNIHFINSDLLEKGKEYMKKCGFWYRDNLETLEVSSCVVNSLDDEFLKLTDVITPLTTIEKNDILQFSLGDTITLVLMDRVILGIVT